MISVLICYSRINNYIGSRFPANMELTHRILSLVVWLLSDPVVDSMSLLSAVVYLYVIRNNSHWQDKGVPYLQPIPLVGNLLPLLTLQYCPGVFIKSIHEQAGRNPYIGFYILGRPALLIRDPALLQHILVKDFCYFTDRHTSSVQHHDPIGASNLFCQKGTKWRHMRTNISSTFSSGHLKVLFQHIFHSASRTCDYIQTQEGKVVNIKSLFVRTAMDTVCSSLLGIQSNTINDPEAQFHQYGKKMVRWTPLRALEVLAHFFVPELIEIFGAVFFEKECTAFLTGAIKESVCIREISGTCGYDFIDTIIRLKKQNMNGKKGELLPSFSENELLAQAVVFFAAGFETSSSTLSFAFYELALNSEIQGRLRSEIKGVLAKHGEVTYNAVQEMMYLDMVVSETLRKYPPMAFVDRTCLQDYCIPGTNIVIERGTPIFVSLLGIQRDPEFYNNPLLFDPMRFSTERKMEILPFTYLPFGDGPRNCIGMRFGLLSVKLVLVLILQKFQVALHIDTPVPLTISPYVFFLKNVGQLPLMFISDSATQQHELNS